MQGTEKKTDAEGMPRFYPAQNRALRTRVSFAETVAPRTEVAKDGGMCRLNIALQATERIGCVGHGNIKERIGRRIERGTAS